MTDSLPNRKRIRLKEFDYSENYMYFITICTKDRKQTLGKVVGYGARDVPRVALSSTGRVVEKYIRLMDNKYNNVFIDKYVIMPNHVHLLIAVSNSYFDEYNDNIRVSFLGTSQAPYPTEKNAPKSTLKKTQGRANGIVPKFVSLFKRYCNMEAGTDIWQRRYYDHVLRNYQDYKDSWQYIENNPAKWALDKYYKA